MPYVTLALLSLYGHKSDQMGRHMQCNHTLERASGKDLKMSMSFFACWPTQALKGRILMQVPRFPNAKTVLTYRQTILSVYDKLRPRRANMVLEASARAGRIFDGFGKPGCDAEWARRELAGIWEPVWNHDLKQEVDEELTKLDKKHTANL